jgi:serine phosphatase RsbU (regulator of sigma subunit)
VKGILDAAPGMGDPDRVGPEALEALADAGAAVARGGTSSELIESVLRAAAEATSADAALARVLEPGGDNLGVRGVVSQSELLAAEVAGAPLGVGDVPAFVLGDLQHASPPVRLAADRIGARHLLQVPVLLGDEVHGSVELYRRDEPFEPAAPALARLAAAQLGLALLAYERDRERTDGASPEELILRTAGDALAAGTDETRAAEQIVRVATDAAGAEAGLLWRVEPDGAPALVAAQPETDGREVEEAQRLATLALAERQPLRFDTIGEKRAVAITLGEPRIGLLQLVFAAGTEPPRERIQLLTGFGVRAAHALRATYRSRRIGLELERNRALLAVVGQAIAQLSLAHTLETAIDRVAELLGAERVAIYLREADRVVSASERGLAGPHALIGERLLELAPAARSGGTLVIRDVTTEPRLASVADAVQESGIECAVAVPLALHGDVIGLLAVYLPRSSSLGENEAELLAALAAQLAVAVENARLHEQAKLLSDERERALAAERHTARRLAALYEISNAFAETLSLDTTLAAVARTIVGLLDVDAAVIRMPDPRRELLLPRALHVADPRLSEPIRTLLVRPQPFENLPIQAVFRSREPIVLDAANAAEAGGVGPLLVPFLEQGSTVAVVPLATPAEVIASVTLLSFDPDRPITAETTEAATEIGAQAALAIDNARLYQQQMHFADTMLRSILPRVRPPVAGLDIGEVYVPSARVEVGGDLYDYIALPDGRLAVVLGDVTGHGVDAAADMTMAKYVFRSLAREHPEPGEFLAFANDVVVGELAQGKFITMVYLTIDPTSGAFACASAGHPAPRLVRADGRVEAIEAHGLALGVEPEQRYEEVRERLDAGDAVALFTDGVIETRRGTEMYGLERLDEVLSRRRAVKAEDLAASVIASARRFAGELLDDCAIVVIKR